MTAAIYAGLAAFFLIFLSARVILLRGATRVSIGHGGDPALERAMRVQANFVEYTPLALILLILVEMQGAPTTLVHALGAGFLLSRLIHFLGVRTREAPGVLRLLGMVGSFALLALMGAIAIGQRLGLFFLTS